jgi:hypothetical protein
MNKHSTRNHHPRIHKRIAGRGSKGQTTTWKKDTLKRKPYGDKNP